MKAARIEGPGSLSIVKMAEPEPGPEEVLIQVMACGVCGTDLHIFRGEYLGQYPVIPGHELAGVVTRVGAAVTELHPGDRVAVEPNIACERCAACRSNRQNFCENWVAIGVGRPGGMAQHTLAPRSNVFPIGELPFEVAAFMEPLSCVIHGAQKAGIRLGDRVALLGAGPIGLLMLQVLRSLGAGEVSVLERNAFRVRKARELGARVLAASMEELGRDHYDLVVDATGSLAVMGRALELARYGGTVLWFGVAPRGQTLPIEPFLVFRKGLTLLSSYTSLRNSLQAIELLSSGQVAVTPIISHRLPLEQLSRGLRLLEQGEAEVGKVLILPGDG